MRRALLVCTAAALAAIGTAHGAPELRAASQKGSQQNPDLLKIEKNGMVLRSAMLKAIFWGPEWYDPEYARDILSGLDTLLAGFSGSDYAFTLTEYHDRTGSISPYTSYAGYHIDTSPPPGPGGLTYSVAIAKVCAVTGNNPDPNGVYFLFTSTPRRPSSSRSCERSPGTCRRACLRGAGLCWRSGWDPRPRRGRRVSICSSGRRP